MQNPRDKTEDALLDAAAKAADGSRERVDQCPGDARIRRNLTRLAALKAAFSRLGVSGEPARRDAPEQWGHLTVLGEIGRGGFGVVHRAFDPVLQREVALKLQRTDVENAPGPGWIEEARRLARVRHPNVLAVHGAGVNDGRVGLWSDLIDGVSLAQSLRSEGAWPRARVIKLARQLASALMAIQAAGLTHGDIKAENVMIEGDRSILMDFGTAAHQGSRPRYGTPCSMAPELLAGGCSTFASDMYSLGVLLCCVALDRDPAGLRDRDSLDSELRRRLGRPLQRLLLRLLSTQPAQRPQADALIAELDRIASLPRVRARRLAVVMVLASLTLGLGASLVALDRTRVERDRSERIKNFLVEGLMQVSPLRANRPASAMEVLDFLDSGLDRRLAGLDDARAEMRLVLGEAYVQFGQVERGLAAVERAVDELESASGASRRDFANALVSLAVVRRRSGDVEGALEAANAAQDALEHIGQSRTDDMARIRLQALRGNIFNGLGRPLSALDAHRRTVAMRAALVGDDDPQLAVDYNNIAAAALRAGLYRVAESAYLESARLLVAGGRGDSGPMGIVQLGLARALIETEGQIERSRQHHQEAERLYQVNYPEGHPNRWIAREMGARIQLASGDLAGAATSYRDLLDTAPDDPALKAAALFQLARVLLDLGQPEEAHERFEECSTLIGDDADPRGIVARAGAAVARWRLGPNEVAPVAALDAAIQTLAESDFANRSELSLLRGWRGSMP